MDTATKVFAKAGRQSKLSFVHVPAAIRAIYKFTTFAIIRIFCNSLKENN